MKTSGWTNVLGTYPSIESKNSTTQTSKDGTPINKDLIDELFGILQAVIYQGNVTPSDTVETYDSSDFTNGIMNIAGSPGEIVFRVNHYIADAYANGERLLYLSGTTVLVANYPDLVARAYCGDAVNGSAFGFYRCDNSDGSGRNTSGIYLYLPDYRGYFIRCGEGFSTGVDPDIRQTSSVQSDGIKDHSHTITQITTNYQLAIEYVNHVSGSDWAAQWSVSGDAFADDSTGTNPDETRPVNIAVRQFVRY